MAGSDLTSWYIIIDHHVYVFIEIVKKIVSEKLVAIFQRFPRFLKSVRLHDLNF